MRAGDVIMLNQRRYDVAAGRLDIEYTFVHDGKIETRPTTSFTLLRLKRYACMPTPGSN